MSALMCLRSVAIAAAVACPGISLAQNADAPAAAPESLVVYFDRGSSTVRPQDEAVLDQASRLVPRRQSHPDDRGRIDGHARRAQLNLLASQQRASTVLRGLIAPRHTRPSGSRSLPRAKPTSPSRRRTTSRRSAIGGSRSPGVEARVRRGSTVRGLAAAAGAARRPRSRTASGPMTPAGSRKPARLGRRSPKPATPTLRSAWAFSTTSAGACREDAAKAYTWYRRAADAGVARALFNVAVMRDSGIRRSARTAPRPPLGTRGRRLEAMAAPSTTWRSHYASGDGVPRNVEQAIVWYRAAADGGLEAAVTKLADLEARRAGSPPEFAQVPAAAAGNAGRARGRSIDRCR